MKQTINGFIVITYKTNPFKGLVTANASLLENSSESSKERRIELGEHTFPTLNNGYCADVKSLKKDFLEMATKKAQELNQVWSITDIYAVA